MEVRELIGWNGHFEKSSVFDPGEGKDIDVWTMVLSEVHPPTGNTIKFSFRKDVRDVFVQQLQSGIWIAGAIPPV